MRKCIIFSGASSFQAWRWVGFVKWPINQKLFPKSSEELIGFSELPKEYISQVFSQIYNYRIYFKIQSTKILKYIFQNIFSNLFVKPKRKNLKFIPKKKNVLLYYIILFFSNTILKPHARKNWFE